MKKKEVRWLSRDRSGIYACFKEEPMKNSHGTFNNKSYIPGTGGEIGILEIVLKKESLAKITIERQY